MVPRVNRDQRGRDTRLLLTVRREGELLIAVLAIATAEEES